METNLEEILKGNGRIEARPLRAELRGSTAGFRLGGCKLNRRAGRQPRQDKVSIKQNKMIAVAMEINK